MDQAHFLIFCCLVSCLKGQVTLDVDRPWLREAVGRPVVLECCYLIHKGTVASTWVRRLHSNSTANVLSAPKYRTQGRSCDRLPLDSVQRQDSGLYQCSLQGTDFQLLTPGTYLQVYEPLRKTINISEEGKNGLLITEGILLLLCVLLPSVTLMYKSKELRDVEKKIVVKQQENIYQGLNLEDRSTAYDQIHRSTNQSEYQDVDNGAQEEPEFEKP